MFKPTYKQILFIFVLIIKAAVGSADSTLVAVAANFSKPMTEIAADFEKSTGHAAKLAFGSSGKFVSQFENGAPFDIFLSADDKSPAKLVQSGLAEADSRFTYAIGKLALWSQTPDYVDAEGRILSNGGFKHLALADPKLAPYGAAALEVLKNMGLLEKLQPLFVQGENIAQTHEFISTGNAELGFVALSQISENGKITSGSAWIAPNNLYSPIRQDAVLLKSASANPAALALMAYLKSPPALAIIKKYGYDDPAQ
ncbi:MAG: molybdate ABC transporter substrate-binding protein [Methylomonas sp.]|jgi:molybdate transport system substrate-binding protein